MNTQPTIRVITLWQPWASAMAFALKKNETRHWSTDYRGPLAIHAAQTRDHIQFWHKQLLPNDATEAHAWRKIYERFEAAGITRADQFPLGQIIAVTNLRDVQTTEDAETTLDVDGIERALGNYGPRRFAWMTEEPVALLKPIKERGRQNFFTWQPPEDFELKCITGRDSRRQWVRK